MSNMESVTTPQPFDTPQQEEPMHSQSTRSVSLLPTYVLIGVLAVLAVLTGFNFFFKPFAEYQPLEETEVVEVVDLPQIDFANLSHEEQVEALYQKMTPEQKIAQLIALPVEADAFLASISALAVEKQEYESQQSAQNESAYINFLTEGDAQSAATESAVVNEPQELFLEDWGFVTLFGEEISRNKALQVISYIDEKNTQKTPIWVMVDHEGGTVQRLSGEGFTQLPAWQTFCLEDAAERLEPVVSSASELAQVGVDVVLAPVVDISAAQPILKSRVCSGDVKTVYEASAAYMTIFNESAILPVLKHFPGIGKTQRDLHIATDSVLVDSDSVELYKQLLSVYDYSAVMTSHVAVVNQDESKPCSLSVDCVGQLKQEYPHVLLITDALEMKSTGINDSDVFLEDIALQAVYAGNSVLLFGPSVSQGDIKIVQDRLLREFNDSYEFRELVNKQVQLILDYKLAK